MMKNNNENQQNGAAPSTPGSVTTKRHAQYKNPEVKEGKGLKGRPVYGSDAGPNTSSRNSQLPHLDNGSPTGGDDSDDNS